MSQRQPREVAGQRGERCSTRRNEDKILRVRSCCRAFHFRWTFPFNIRNQKFVITARFRPLCQFALTSASCSTRVYSPPCPVWHSACSNLAGRWVGGLAVNYLSTPLRSFMATPFPPSRLIHRFLSTLLAVASFLAWQFLISLCLPFCKPAPPSPSHFPIWEGINTQEIIVPIFPLWSMLIFKNVSFLHHLCVHMANYK